jgi:hypothetical protein
LSRIHLHLTSQSRLELQVCRFFLFLFFPNWSLTSKHHMNPLTNQFRKKLLIIVQTIKHTKISCKQDTVETYNIIIICNICNRSTLTSSNSIIKLQENPPK